MKHGLKNNPVLTPLQRDTLKLLFSETWFQERFYLTGGTALSAFYLQHRYSDDLDLFTHEDFPRNLTVTTKELFEQNGYVAEVKQQTPQFIRMLINTELQLDFIKDVAVRYGTPSLWESVVVDTELNIAVNKVGAILGRLDAKDYVDLYFLLREKRYCLDDLFKKAVPKDGGLEPFTWARIIGDCETFAQLPRMIVDLDLGDLKVFFSKLRSQILAKLNPATHG